jgi:uncharacterized protein
LLINRFWFIRMESIGFAVKKTLESMAKGGFHDQLGGGFHRYSVDEAWTIPHFEKMADDNAWHLRNYIDAYAVFGDESFKEVAEGIIRFISATLSDPDGGFYASQDADVTPDDEGGYFTWTDEEFRNILNDEEYMVLSLHFFNGKGAMHHDATKTVLHISQSAGEIAEKTGMELEKVSEIIGSAKQKLLAYRNKRETPFIDSTFYTSLNGMMIASYLKAYRILKDETLKDFALKSLDRIKELHFVDGRLFHTEGVKALLDDYIYLSEALIEAYEVTGHAPYIEEAENFMGICLNKFRDTSEGGFFDTDSDVLGLRLKTIEDIPNPSANALAIMLLLKLSAMTGKTEYHQYAEAALKRFTQYAKKAGLHAGFFYCAMDAYYHMLKLFVEAAPGSELAGTALSTSYPYKGIVYGKDTGTVIPCLGNVCQEPINNTSDLRDFLNNL